MNSSERLWQTSLMHPQLAEDEVHVWRASLDAEASVLHTFQRILTEEELAKAKRFHFEKDRHHFIVAHGVLRILLGRYLNADPSLLQFASNMYGKPSLSRPFDESRLCFNISHSHEVALYALTYARQLGVDVEYMSSDIDYEQLAKYSFSSHEQATLRTLPQALKRQAFFNCWTRKEAYIKARGMGLSLSLDLFDVSLRPGDPVMLLASREDPHETTRWSLQELAPSYGYASALAVEGSGYSVSHWQWQNIMTPGI